MVESFESQEEDFEIDTLFDGEPVVSVENGTDVFTRWNIWSLWRE